MDTLFDGERRGATEAAPEPVRPGRASLVSCVVCGNRDGLRSCRLDFWGVVVWGPVPLCWRCYRRYMPCGAANRW